MVAQNREFDPRTGKRMGVVQLAPGWRSPQQRRNEQIRRDRRAARKAAAAERAAELRETLRREFGGASLPSTSVAQPAPVEQAVDAVSYEDSSWYGDEEIEGNQLDWDLQNPVRRATRPCEAVPASTCGQRTRISNAVYARNGQLCKKNCSRPQREARSMNKKRALRRKARRSGI